MSKEKRMNITIISPYYEPEITACTYYYVDLANDLNSYGCNVTVVCGIPTRLISKEVTQRYIEEPIEKINDTFRVVRVGRSKGEGKNLIKRAIVLLKRTSDIYKTAKNIETDAYLICSAPPFTGVIGALLAKRAPTLYNLQDIFPDNMIDGGKIKRGSIVHKVLSLIERYINNHNTHLITISNDMKLNLLSKKIHNNKISVVHNWIDVKKVKRVEKDNNILFSDFKLDTDSFYVSYCGNIGLFQDIDLILDAAKLVQSKHPEIKFIILGNGSYEETMKNRIKNECIDNILLFPFQPNELSSEIYSLGDIGIVALKKDMCASAMPSKTWTMMSASQPILCTAANNSELFDMLVKSDSGLTVIPGDFKDLAEKIIHMYNNRDELKKYGSSGRSYVENKLSKESATIKYYDCLTKLVEKEY